MLEIKNVSKVFEKFIALNEVNITIPKARTFGLVGSNGAGKSTLLRLLTGVYNCDEGELLMDGKPIWNTPESKQNVFFINDETVQFQSFTLRELKDYYKCYYPKFSEATFENLRKKINLPLDKKLSKFSKGMKRQSVVLVALSAGTDYLLLDEAFDGLDPAMRLIVKRMVFDAMLDRELTLIISSHNLAELNEMCDSVAMLHEGRVLFQKDLDSIKGDIHKVQLVFNKSGEENKIYDRACFPQLNILHFERQGSIYNLIIKEDEKKLKEIIGPEKPIVFDIVPLTLEEVFIYELEVLGYDSSGIQTNS
ncbi:MAG: ABC transporter ATP-binding protein [Ruminococcus sp.]|jgi:ABC-2 type transport system ATP-binding protein|nr:ABC transporter ATP-binding protein [Ruminococcus sp.]